MTDTLMTNNQYYIALFAFVFWLATWLINSRLAVISPKNMMARRLVNFAIPTLFGVTLLVLWECMVRAFDIPAILLPAPSAIMFRLLTSIPILAADFRQTVLKSVVIGYALGCGLGFIVAILIDRSPFLKAGLLPIGNFVSALPIVGMAPIMVMWLGFDWPSKAAVVVIVTFFPMMVNTLEGLTSASAIERDLMQTYAASYCQSLFYLRLPAASPMIFNGLKINAPVALITALIAEFFGTPIVGMGFRISTEVGRSNIDMVWAEITVAALSGSLFYALIAAFERLATFWHPSMRKSASH